MEKLNLKKLEYQMKIEMHNLDGLGSKKTRAYPLPSAGTDYWSAVTDVPCPCCDYGTICWAEAGYAPGYRICDRCGKHFILPILSLDYR